MKKISLQVDALRVESFETTTGLERHPGTIQAASITDEDCDTQYLSYCPSCGDTHCVGITCGEECQRTYIDSCAGSCGYTCEGCSDFITCANC